MAAAGKMGFILDGMNRRKAVICPQGRSWVPSSVDAWYAGLAEEIADLGPAATVDYVERLAARQEERTESGPMCNRK